ncbi:uncharacterized protein EAF02_010916 [Botrytis sinoallii]|uniref:uncharacterized protein n=1 Tax=Botrytis sinoallii TaxID=1463999 RepID=UPI001902462E|nr:uncharacterized protein EAF02_010916 [Botrytis sinoallii]KAF7859468.1 hypothetical protein EAF02_010916 [Botrytis sinoallii]
MPSNVYNNRESCPTKDYDTMTQSEAIDAIKTRTKSLERLMVHKNPSLRQKAEELALKTKMMNLKRSNPALKIVQNQEILNLSWNWLKILHEHRQEFQVDIKTVEEYLFLLRKLQPANDKDWARKISIASEIMTESTVMRSNIEARIQEVENFLSEMASEKVSLKRRKEMVLDLGIRHGIYGTTLTLRDHDKFPQDRYRKLIDVDSLEKQVRGAEVVFKKLGL